MANHSGGLEPVGGKKPDKKDGKKHKDGGNYNRILGLLTGFTVTGIGVGYLGGALGLWAAIPLSFSLLWPLAIILPCLAGVISAGLNSPYAFGLIFGVLAMLARIGVIASVWKLLVPAAILYAGLTLILKNKPFGYRRVVNAEDGRSFLISVYRGLFVPRKIKDEDTFRGAEIAAWFSPVTLDLTEAKFEKETAVYVKAVFASVTIRVPPDINLNARKTSGAGRLYLEAKNYTDLVNVPTLHICAACVFNSVTVMN